MPRKPIILAGLAVLLLCNIGLAAYVLLQSPLTGLRSPSTLGPTEARAAVGLPPPWTATPEHLAPQPTPTSTQAALLPTEVRQFVVASAVAAADANATDSARWVNRIMDQQRQVRIRASEPLLWGTGWCASSPEMLDANFQAMDAQLFVNGEPIGADNYAVRDYGNPDPANRTYCRSHFVLVTSWPVGSTTLKACYLIRQAVNDGWSDYPPGYSCSNFTVELTGS